jgi:hypothetical protein
MAIILSFYTGEQICQDCAQQPEAPCTKCSPDTDAPPPVLTADEHDRLVLDTTAD